VLLQAAFAELRWLCAIEAAVHYDLDPLSGHLDGKHVVEGSRHVISPP